MKTIAPDFLISLTSEEYECQCAQHTCCNGPGKAKDKEKDKDLTVIPGKSKGKEHKPHGICWNCGDKGHYKDKCPKPVVEKANSPKKTGTAAANTVIQSDSDDNGVFFMECEDDTDMPELQLVSDSEDDPESDDNKSLWFTDVKDEIDNSWDSKELSGVDWSKTSLFVNVDLDSEAAKSDNFVAQVGASKSDVP